MGVAAADDTRADFSNSGSGADLIAPGVSVLSTLPGAYGKMSGTSMASPIVAGCASLVLAAHPGYSPTQVERALKETATDLGAGGFDNEYGYGKVNAYAAVSGEQPEPEPRDPEPGGDWDPPEPGGETVWYLAEGYTGPGFQTYVLVQNPNPETASLRAEFVDPGGNYLEKYYSLKGGSHLTLNLNAIFPTRDVSTCISSLNDVGIVVERSMYFNSAGRTDGHCTPGSPGLSTTWFFAEGYTGPGFDEYILVLNPWFSSNRMQLTLYDAAGGEQTFDYWLMPASRLTLHINELAPGKDVSAKVETVYGAVAERPCTSITAAATAATAPWDRPRPPPPGSSPRAIPGRASTSGCCCTTRVAPTALPPSPTASPTAGRCRPATSSMPAAGIPCT